jgi:hypothetical protein
VQLQSWFLDTWAKYWIVRSKATAAPLAIPQHSSSVSGELHGLEQQEIKVLERLEQDYTAQGTKLENSEESSWLCYTQWPA